MDKKQKISDVDVRKAVDEVFQQYDTDRTGYLECEEIISVIRDVFFSKNTEREVSEDDIRTVMHAMDRNLDGKISRDELFVAIKKFSNR
jgi:hypothetical protein